MNVTGTGVAVALAVVFALGFLFFGPAILTPSAVISPPVTMNSEENLAAYADVLPTELTVTDLSVGEGAEAASGDLISVNYIGAFPDNTIFDASASHGGPFTFRLGVDSVIQGWQKGLVGMKEGGTRILIIPPHEGYGPDGYGSIPPNATLIFKVELVKVEKAQ